MTEKNGFNIDRLVNDIHKLKELRRRSKDVDEFCSYTLQLRLYYHTYAFPLLQYERAKSLNIRLSNYCGPYR